MEKNAPVCCSFAKAIVLCQYTPAPPAINLCKFFSFPFFKSSAPWTTDGSRHVCTVSCQKKPPEKYELHTNFIVYQEIVIILAIMREICPWGFSVIQVILISECLVGSNLTLAHPKGFFSSEGRCSEWVETIANKEDAFESTSPGGGGPLAMHHVSL